jgi:NitT/TauT family transport system substrate-binding protein
MIGAKKISTLRTAFEKSLAACAIAAAATGAYAAEAVRLAMPTQGWWPTTVATAADRLGMFAKEGVKPEITIYKGGGPAFEALAADAADITCNPAYLVALGQGKGVKTRIVATASTVYSGWQLIVPANSKIKDVSDLAGKKIGITANGSISDFLALWTTASRNVQFTRVPIGAGGLVPALRSGNIDAAVMFSPLSFEVVSKNMGRSLLDFGKTVPADLNAGWIATESIIKSNPKAVQGSINALIGATVYLQKNRDYAVKLIAELNGITPELAEKEYEASILAASSDGVIDAKSVNQSVEMGKLGGLKGLSAPEETFVTTFKAVPTRP